MGLRRLGFLPLILSAGCLPSRDNSWDPNNAPGAGLVIRDFTPVAASDDACNAALVLDSAFEVVSAASRGSCLALEAIGSSLTDGSLRFLLVATAGIALEEPREIEPVVNRRAALTPSFLRTLPAAVALEIELRATDRNGDHAQVRAPLVLLNTAPIASADPRRILPSGGYSWPGAIAQPFAVEFRDGGSIDPDGDELQHCWTFPGENEGCYTNGDPPPVRLLSSTSGAYVARYRVKDDLGTPSEYTAAIVEKRTPPVWAHSPGGLVAVDATRTSLDETLIPGGTTNFGLGIVFPTGPVDRALLYDNSDLRLTSWPPPQASPVIQTLTPSASVERLIADPEAGRVWGLRMRYTPAGYIAQSARWSVDALTLSEEADFADATGTALALATAKPIGDVDPEGALWMGVAGRALVLRQVPGSTGTAAGLGGAGRGVSGLAVRPGGAPADFEVWALVTASAGNPALTVPGALLRYRNGSTTPEVVTDEAALTGASALAWIDNRQFWLVTPARGLVRVDATLLEDGLSFDEAIRDEHPVGGASWVTSGNYARDPSSGAFLLCDGVRSVLANLESVEVDEGLECEYPSIGRDGRAIWRRSFTSGPIAISEGHTGRSPRLGLGPRMAVPYYLGMNSPTARDSRTGGLWIATGRPSLVHLFPDGRFQEFAEAQTSSGIIPMPRFLSLDVSFDGSTAWAIAGTSASTAPAQVIWLDLTQPVPFLGVAGDVSLAAPLASVITFNGNAIEPGGVDGSFAWISRVDPGDSLPEIAKLTKAGVITRVLALPGEVLTGGQMNVSLAGTFTGGLCASTRSSIASNRMRYVGSTGSAVILEDLSYMTGEGFIALGYSGSEGSDVCWAIQGESFTNSGYVIAWDTTPQRVREYYGPFALSFLPQNRGEIWLSERDNQGAFHGVHDFFAPAPTGSPTTSHTFEGDIFRLVQ